MAKDFKGQWQKVKKEIELEPDSPKFSDSEYHVALKWIYRTSYKYMYAIVGIDSIQKLKQVLSRMPSKQISELGRVEVINIEILPI